MPGLTPRQTAFVQEYLVTLNATKAAIAAGYSPASAESQGSRLLSNVKVAKAIKAGQAKRAERVQLKADDVLRQLEAMYSVDPAKAFNPNGGLLGIHDIPVETRRAISSVEVEEIWAGPRDARIQIGELKKVKLWDKNTAVANAMKHLGLLDERLRLANSEGGPLEVVVQTVCQHCRKTVSTQEK